MINTYSSTDFELKKQYIYVFTFSSYTNFFVLILVLNLAILFFLRIGPLLSTEIEHNTWWRQWIILFVLLINILMKIYTNVGFLLIWSLNQLECVVVWFYCNKGIRALRFSESMEETRAMTKVEEDVVRKTAETLGLRIKMLHRWISWEEFDERWFKGLCMFCNELDHYIVYKPSRPYHACHN